MGAGVSSCWLTAYTLSGVDTTVPPLTAKADTGTSTTSTGLSANVSGVLAGSWAAVSSCLGTVGYMVTNTATGGTAITITDNADDSSTANAGYVTNLSAGTDTFTSSFSVGTKACFAVSVFPPPSAHPISVVKVFGIKFLGGTTDPVTTTAGVYPISGWNNIANASYTAGTIYSSDGSVAVTLTLSGSGSDNTYNSGAFSDGGNSSLMDGYQDAGQNNPATDVISGLTGTAYDVFLYTGGDNARPSSGTDYLPNYTINGTRHYTATLKGYDAILQIVQSVPSSQNSSTYPTTLVAGQYLEISNVVPVGGKITITANSDNLTCRSPLNGIELVSISNTPQVMVQPVPHRLYTGGGANFQVQAKGANPLAYQWRQNGTNLIEGGNITGSQTTNLTINNLALTETGNYNVVITNSYGSVTSSVANLNVVVETTADAAFDAWVAAFVVTNGYQTYIVNSLQNRNFAFMWQQAYMIWMVEDTYDRTKSPDQQRLINALLNTFIHQNGITLTWDGWDDDLEWGDIALIRGYEITGNVVALNSAISVWNAVNSRGWDNTFGGGIWEELPPPTSKCALSNYPQIIAGMHLYQITGQTNYLTTCQTIYNWAYTNLFIATAAQATNGMPLGQVNEGVAWADTNQINTKVLVSNNSYNSGLFVNAACALYQATGNTQYLSDAILAANQKVNVEPIVNEDHVANGDFGAEQLLRAVALIASQNQNNLWPLSAWAWGMSRCVDYLETQSFADTNKFIALGHSRLGKATLVAGAFDERFALVAPAGSGCAGTGAYRFNGKAKTGRAGLNEIVKNFPQWTIPSFVDFSNRVERLPFDQHWLIDLVAPRVFIAADGLDDTATCINALVQSYIAAEPVYALLGVPDHLGINFRPGPHHLAPEDWTAVLDFADPQLRAKDVKRRFDQLPPQEL